MVDSFQYFNKLSQKKPNQSLKLLHALID